MTTRISGHTLRAVLLDLDHTIIDDRRSVESARQTVAALAVERWKHLSAQSVVLQLERSAREFWSRPLIPASRRLDQVGTRRRIIGDALDALGVADAEFTAYLAHRYSMVREASPELADGASAALDFIRATFSRVALVTNGSSEVQRRKLVTLDLVRYFDEILIEEEYGLGKPDPRVFEHVACRLGVSVSESIMVGDHYECDIRGAVGAGLLGMWIVDSRAFEKPSRIAVPHWTAKSLLEFTQQVCVT